MNKIHNHCTRSLQQHNCYIAVLLVLLVAHAGQCQAEAMKADQNAKPVSGANYPLTNGVVIPIRYDPVMEPLPTVQIRVNGSEPLTFLLDTGTDGLIISSHEAKRLKLDVKGVPKGGGNSPGVVGLADVKRVEFAEVSFTLPVEKLVVLDRYFDPTGRTMSSRIVGILGIQLLQLFPVRLDFSKQEMVGYISSRGNAPLNIPGAEHLKLQLKKDYSTCNLYGAEIAFGNKKASFLLDTGSRLSGLSEADRKRLDVRTNGLPIYQSYESALNEVALTKIERLAELDLGGIKMRYVPILTFASKSGLPSILGMDVLSRFRVTIDIPNNDLWLEPLSQDAVKRTNFLDGREEISLQQEGKGFFVSQVSPYVQKLDVMVGDQVQKIDGVDVSGSDWASTYRLLLGCSGTDAHLTLLRKGQMREVSYKRRSIFSETEKEKR